MLSSFTIFLHIFLSLYFCFWHAIHCFIHCCAIYFLNISLLFFEDHINSIQPWFAQFLLACSFFSDISDISMLQFDLHSLQYNCSILITIFVFLLHPVSTHSFLILSVLMWPRTFLKNPITRAFNLLFILIYLNLTST